MHQHVVSRLAFASLVLAASSAWWGCTATSGGSQFTTSSTDGSGAGGGQGTSTGSGGESTIDLDAGGKSDVIDPLSDASACTGTSTAAQQIPLDMVVLIDRSGSMSGEKWDTVTTALKAFFQDNASAGIGAGLVYFPNDNNDDCVWTDYANLNVPIASLPGNAPALVASIDATSVTGMTPTWGALKGALYAATTFQDANTNHKVIVVLATDGDPTSCSSTDTATIANLAKSARNYNGVQTYVLGMQGATVSNLDQIAAAGGTGTAYDITQNVSQFAAKMAEIRTKAAACEFLIPPPPSGQQLDPGKVNVSYTPGGSTTSSLLPNVMTASTCGNSQAWYYDSNTNPKKIILCPKICTKVQTDPAAEISVLLGCKTQQG